MTQSKPLSGRRDGAAAAELAFTLPLLLLLLAGVWEVGRLVEVRQLLSNAAREGARQASTGVKNYTDVQAAVVNYLAGAGITNTAGIQVEVHNLTKSDGPAHDPTTAEQMDHLQVTVTLPAANVRWVLLNQFAVVDTLAAAADWYSMKDRPVTVTTTLPVE